MKKNIKIVSWLLLGYLLFSFYDVQAAEPLCTSVAGQTCATECIVGDQQEMPNFSGCAGMFCCRDIGQVGGGSGATGGGSGGGSGATGGGSEAVGGSAVNYGYSLLEKIPGTEGLTGSDFPGYLSAVYKVALIVVTLSAVFMLSVGGFMYLTSAGNTSAIGTAKGIIYDSLIGLVIALSAWLILYVINPDLVKMTLEGLSPVPVEAPPATPSGTGTLPSGTDQELAKQILDSRTIDLSANGTCKSSEGKTTPKQNIQEIANGERMTACTHGCNASSIGCVGGATQINHTMLVAMLAVAANNTNYTVTSISGGSHATKSAHYKGRAIDIDIIPKGYAQRNLDYFVKAGALAPNGNAGSMCEDEAGQNVGCEPSTTADHIHLVFP